MQHVPAYLGAAHAHALLNEAAHDRQVRLAQAAAHAQAVRPPKPFHRLTFVLAALRRHVRRHLRLA
ncbi:hypothetical protein [Deinococcus sp.]|uniref:hypothetical protein n=1 Tax=Deinococcus sp. TaxID=47478 RepID=UPI0025B81886|nr:hypothetical protein [Deinococcus sp.]